MHFDYIKPEYLIMIGASLIIIFSFIFNFISIKTNIPSVLLLMMLGVAIQFIYPELKENPLISKALVVVGKVGLILIVLEAALDLKIKKDKIRLIIKSFLMALFGLIGSSLLIALGIQYFLETSFYEALVYAVPLSIMSSAIIIPSVTMLSEYKKEFMIYESTFSDILGIILFQFLTSSEEFYSTTDVVFSVSSNIVITIIVAVAFSYITVWSIQKLTSHVKLFLIIAVLMLVYALGSISHLSSLIIILFFGLILNNTDIFFIGRFKKLIQKERIKPIFKEFYVITLESAFILRTFFFVMFGVTISLISLVNYEVAIQSIAFVTILYAVRFMFLKIIFWNKSITPELFIAPRGLITVLLFYTIPAKYVIENFNQGILLYTILITSAIMTIALVVKKGGKNISDVLHDYDELHDTIERSLEEGHHNFENDN
ncbi:cation:proton antiporter [Lutibacter sp.]|uniref:cation:proton antiporter domain-containing protein n=1 Tax=Lutibacter sp. TaxID=1925666 RepID=UPI0025B86CAE|nr:cation:proton antiporter [Lutibacter sp.]MCF6182846.1 cation:proton antiporter [Lutibacter sp.]